MGVRLIQGYKSLRLRVRLGWLGGLAMMLRMRRVAEDMERRLLLYSLKETQFGEDEGLLVLVENNRYFV